MMRVSLFPHFLDLSQTRIRHDFASKKPARIHTQNLPRYVHHHIHSAVISIEKAIRFRGYHTSENSAISRGQASDLNFALIEFKCCCTYTNCCWRLRIFCQISWRGRQPAMMMISMELRATDSRLQEPTCTTCWGRRFNERPSFSWILIATLFWTAVSEPTSK